MSAGTLFEPPGSFDRRALASALARLAEEAILIGASSWKYEGWLGQIYSRERYVRRGGFSKKYFEDTCLAEYAETFPVVCGDFSFYQFPSEAYWRRLFGSAPARLRYAFKTPEQITVKTYPTHARYGARGGQDNPSFLDPGLFQDAFLRPLEPYRAQVAALILEFGTFSKKSYAQAADFLADLDRFLAALPPEWRYAVEIRNPEYLDEEHLGCLRAHNVAHVFNAWTRMPELGAQLRIPSAWTADFTVCRALLRRARSYEQAVNLFSPYEEIKDPNPEGRQALRDLIAQARDNRRAAFIFVNNRFEGSAPLTIQAVLE